MDIAEKRVYDDATGTVAVAIASETGLVVAAVSDDIVGEFGLAVRRPISDLAVLEDGKLAIATPEDVLVVPVPDSAGSLATVPDPISTGFGVAEVVSTTEESLVAAGPAGIATTPIQSVDGVNPDWTVHEESGKAVRSADGPFLATDDGVLRVDPDGLSTLGLENVMDVAAGDPPLAATQTGWYQLDSGWQQVQSGETSVVTTGPEQAHAVTDTGVWVDDGEDWSELSWPLDALPVDITYDRASEKDDLTTTIATTETGTLVVDAGDGWRRRALGVHGVEACSVW